MDMERIRYRKMIKDHTCSKQNFWLTLLSTVENDDSVKFQYFLTKEWNNELCSFYLKTTSARLRYCH